MSGFERPFKFCLLLTCGMVLLVAQAQAFDLNGAWATSAEACGKIFVKKGDQFAFTQVAEEFGGGFVADGKQIRSKAARCTIKSRKETGDTIDVRAACISDILATSILLRIKVLNDNTVSREFTDPDMEGMQLTYYRCTMWD